MPPPMRKEYVNYFKEFYSYLDERDPPTISVDDDMLAWVAMETHVSGYTFLDIDDSLVKDYRLERLTDWFRAEDKDAFYCKVRWIPDENL